MYALPPIGRPPWLRDFYYWYGFFPGLALLDKPSGVGDYKGPCAIAGPLQACICGTQHWDSMQYTHNYAFSRTAYNVHTRGVNAGRETVIVFR